MFDGRVREYRLLNEVEWEWVAGGKQGTSGERVRQYPWPEERGEAKPALLNYNNNVGATTPVGSYPDGATPEGLYDMAWIDMIKQYHDSIVSGIVCPINLDLWERALLIAKVCQTLTCNPRSLKWQDRGCILEHDSATLIKLLQG